MSDEGQELTRAERETLKKANGTPVAYRPTVRIKRRKSRLHWWVLGVALTLALPVTFIVKQLLGIRTVLPDAEAFALDDESAGESGFPHEVLDEVLSTYVIDGRVDYQGLAENSQLLRRYAATLAEVGPNEDENRFPRREDRLAYYINAYNALVLLGIIEFWPIETVLQIRGRIEPVTGSGFFWSLRFRLDGDSISLYDLENDIIREGFNDARIHAAIVCGARSCPRLLSSAYHPDSLEQDLDAAARRFASYAPYMRVDHESREILLSAIYEWYADDFIAHAQQLEVGETVLDWIRHYARPEVAADLETAEASDYAIRYVDYDWHVNDRQVSRVPSPAASPTKTEL